MIRRPARSTGKEESAASDVYKRQPLIFEKKEIDLAVQTFKETLKEIEQGLNR